MDELTTSPPNSLCLALLSGEVQGFSEEASARKGIQEGQLNCLIVGRGAGKTTALEFRRFGLGLMPDPKTNL